MSNPGTVHERVDATVRFGINTRLGRVPYVVAVSLVLRYPAFHYGTGHIEAFDVAILGDLDDTTRHANQHTRRIGFVAKRTAGWVRKPTAINEPEEHFQTAQEAALALAADWLRKHATDTWEETWQAHCRLRLPDRKAS